jgi:hypothetical protein
MNDRSRSRPVNASGAIASFAVALFFSCAAGPAAAATLEEKIARLPAQTFCVNAGHDISWEALLETLKELEISPTLKDRRNGVVTTGFVLMKPMQLMKMAKNPRPFRQGRFTMKIELAEETPAYTRLAITLQARQNTLTKKERILKSNGAFEKFVAMRVNELAVQKQFPEIYEIRLGMNLVPDLASKKYHVSAVEPLSPAGESGFKDGDVVLSIDGRELSIGGEIFTLLLSAKPEKLLKFRVERESGIVELPVWVIRAPDARRKIGLALDWDPVSKQFIVAGVEAKSQAAKAGIRPSDRLVMQDEIPLNSWTNFYRAMAREKKREPIRFRVERGGEVLTLAV